MVFFRVRVKERLTRYVRTNERNVFVDGGVCVGVGFLALIFVKGGGKRRRRKLGEREVERFFLMNEWVDLDSMTIMMSRRWGVFVNVVFFFPGEAKGLKVDQSSRSEYERKPIMYL